MKHIFLSLLFIVCLTNGFCQTPITVDPVEIQPIQSLVMEPDTYIRIPARELQCPVNQPSYYCRFRSFLDICEYNHTPARNFAESICRNGSILQKSDGTLSFRGAQNEPLAFIDGVKIRGSYVLPAHAVLFVNILTHAIPADIGDTDSGCLLFVTRHVSY